MNNINCLWTINLKYFAAGLLQNNPASPGIDVLFLARMPASFFTVISLPHRIAPGTMKTLNKHFYVDV